MYFTLEVLRAQEGDCLLLHFGSKSSPKLALVDGGPGRVYEEHLTPRLAELAKNGKLDLELVMVSHIDGDHITGIKKLFRRLAKDLDDHVPSAVRVRRLWHNTFNDIVDDPNDAYYQTFTSSFVASSDGEPDPQAASAIAGVLATDPNEQAPEQLAFRVASVLASQADGRALRDDFQKLRAASLIAPLNDPIRKKGKPTLVALQPGVARRAKIGNLTLHVVGPSKAQIDALQEKFDEYIQANGLTTASLLAAYADESVANLSSIVCLATTKEGGVERSILLTGDARGDHVLEGLEATGYLPKNGSMYVDVLKVPHHGSDRNADPDFFERIVADTYVFSGNGKYGNPDRSTLEMLVNARGASDEYSIVMTYTMKETDQGAKKDAAKNGKSWKRSRDSVEDFLTKKKQAGYRFEIVDGAPIRIDLGSDDLP